MNKKWILALLAGAGVVIGVCLAGCASLDRAAYNQEVVWTNVPTVHVVTNTVVRTNFIPVVQVRTNTVYVTNSVSGEVSSIFSLVPETNMLPAPMTNLVTQYVTNFVPVQKTNLVAKPEVETTITAVGTAVNTFVPGIGSIVALALGGLYHGYKQVRNKKVNEALVQGVETARAVLTSTPQGQAMDAQFVKWLMEHQKEAGVFFAVTSLVDQFSDNPAANLTAQTIRERVQQALQANLPPSTPAS